MLRQLAEEGRQLRSKLDAGTLEADNLRQELEAVRREARGLEGRSEEMEKELIESIRNQKNYSELQGKSGSMQAEIEILQNELAESTRLNIKLGDLEARLVELTSRLEIAELDRDSLRQELDELRGVREHTVVQAGEKPIEKDN
jgi:chromosome segregation ATPase